MVLQILNTKFQRGMVAPQMVGREWDKLALELDLSTEHKVEIGENCQYYAWSTSFCRVSWQCLLARMWRDLQGGDPVLVAGVMSSSMEGLCMTDSVLQGYSISRAF